MKRSLPISQDATPPSNRQFRLMLMVSILLHCMVFAGIVGYFFLSAQFIDLSLSGKSAPVVELYAPNEVPDLPQQQPEKPEEPEKQSPPQNQTQIAFRNFSALGQLPLPTPTAAPKASPTPLPVFTPPPQPAPKPRPRPTPTPMPLQPQATPVVIEIPRRKPVLEQRPSQQELQTILRRNTPQDQPQTGRTTGAENGSETGTSETGNFGASTGGLFAGPAVALDQENEFPFPEYLGYVGEKIQGLWFPQGSGNVSLILIIGRDGKILKSGVDKREGVDVEKLRESVVRAVMLIKRFDALPQAYSGAELRVRISVRR